MKQRLTVLLIFIFVFSACTACTNTAPNSQTPETSNSTKPQATQQIQTPTPSPSVIKEAQGTINKDNAITKTEVLSFFNGDNELAPEMLHYPAIDMNNLEQVMAMMLYSLGALHDNPITFDLFNKYTKKYLNKTYTDSDFAKFATDEEVCGINVNMEKRDLFIFCVGGEDILIKNVEITGNDSALFNCYRGLNRDEPDTMREVSFYVQFGRSDSQLHIKSIWETDTKEVSR